LNEQEADMQCVILYRTHNGQVDFVRDGDAGLDIYVFPDEEAAIRDTRERLLFQAVPFQIVLLDEL
jgi:hypothetical protein